MAKTAQPKSKQNVNGNQQGGMHIPEEIVKEVAETVDASMISWGATEDLSDLWDEYVAAESREERQAAMREMRGIIADVLGVPPVEWLVKNAPDNLNWSDPDSYRHLQRNYMMAMIRFISGADTESASGN